MTTLATSNRRLLKLADFLDKLPPERFDYSSWVGDDWGGRQDLSCGTTACALGWATTMPEFRRLGLRLDRRLMEVTNAKENVWDSFEAAQVTFGLDSREAHLVFSPRVQYLGLKAPGAYAGPVEVADHIRRFVAVRGQ